MSASPDQLCINSPAHTAQYFCKIGMHPLFFKTSGISQFVFFDIGFGDRTAEFRDDCLCSVPSTYRRTANVSQPFPRLYRGVPTT